MSVKSRPATASSSRVSSAASAASKVIENLSRAGGTAKSWTKEEDPEKGRPTSAGFDALIEEEMAQAELDSGDQGAEPKGCWESLVGQVSSVWRTTDMLNGEERESIVKTSTREFAIYILFMCILSFGKI